MEGWRGSTSCILSSRSGLFAMGAGGGVGCVLLFGTPCLSPPTPGPLLTPRPELHRGRGEGQGLNCEPAPQRAARAAPTSPRTQHGWQDPRLFQLPPECAPVR